MIKHSLHTFLLLKMYTLCPLTFLPAIMSNTPKEPIDLKIKKAMFYVIKRFIILVYY